VSNGGYIGDPIPEQLLDESAIQRLTEEMNGASINESCEGKFHIDFIINFVHS